MIQKYSKQFCYVNLFWVIIFLIDYGIELFQVSNSERITMMGLFIKNTENDNGIYTIFGMTPKLFMVYFSIVLGWLMIYAIFEKIRRKS